MPKNVARSFTVHPHLAHACCGCKLDQNTADAPPSIDGGEPSRVGTRPSSSSLVLAGGALTTLVALTFLCVSQVSV